MVNGDSHDGKRGQFTVTVFSVFLCSNIPLGPCNFSVTNCDSWGQALSSECFSLCVTLTKKQAARAACLAHRASCSANGEASNLIAERVL
jgi:hypothetical protein